jgi:RHS repeat-associated protein
MMIYFTGHEKESDLAEGIYTTEYRLYDARVGRWLSVDPLWLDNAGESPYLYCSGMPMTYFDPDGREKIIDFPCAYPKRSELEGKTGIKQRKIIKDRVQNARFLEPWARQYTRNRGVIHTFQHGINGSAGVTYNTPSNSDGYIHTVEDFEKKMLNKSVIYKNNKCSGKTSLLVMHSCQAGREKGGFAQKLSEKLDLVVVAPSNNIIVQTNDDGTFSDSVENNGVYNIYYKGVLLESFDGDTKPLFDKPDETIKKYKSMYEEKLIKESSLEEFVVTPKN